MLRPESTSAAIRPALTEFAQEYFAQSALSKFIGLRSAPLFKGAKRTAQYPVFNRESFKKRVGDQTRAPGGAYNRISGLFGRRTYTCEENGLEFPCDDVFMEQYAEFFDGEDAATDIVVQQILMGHEARVAALYIAMSLTNHNVSTAWSTVASADPVGDFDAGFNTIGDACGAKRSEISIIMPRADWQELQRVTQIVNLVRYVWSGSTNNNMIPAHIPEATVAAALGCKEILVGDGSYDNAEEGATESNTQFWAAGVMYMAVLSEQDAPLRRPSAARTILWTADSPDFPVIESYREEQTRSDIIRGRFQTDEVQTADDNILTYQLTNT